MLHNFNSTPKFPQFVYVDQKKAVFKLHDFKEFMITVFNSWVLNLMIGSICNCVLPQSLKISAVRHDPCGQPFDSERRRLRNAFGCLSSISMRQKQLSTSSILLQSPLKGCLPWELRRSMNGSMKERWELLQGLFIVHRGFDIFAWWLATKP